MIMMLTGLLVDCPRVDCMLVHNIAAVVAGVATCLVPLLDRYELLLAYAAIFGVSIGQFRVNSLECKIYALSVAVRQTSSHDISMHSVSFYNVFLQTMRDRIGYAHSYNKAMANVLR